ncbi:MAG: hypothetical protein CM15mP21_1280 [Hyphomicrobiales bacterium]|nr:MAG: hypothetical protein CM15mP21_1280 [Hyphomicrobiales bacterium]
MAALEFWSIIPAFLRDKSFAKMEIAVFDSLVDVHLFGTMKPPNLLGPDNKGNPQGLADYGLPLHHPAFTEISRPIKLWRGQKLGVVGFINTLKLKGPRKRQYPHQRAGPVAGTA